MRTQKTLIVLASIASFVVFAFVATTPTRRPTAPIADYVLVAKDKERFVLGCAILNEGALNTGNATGRIFDSSNSDHCRSIPVGTPVLSQERFRNAVCVVPAGASLPCVWVFNDELKPVQATPPASGGPSV
jgi:hypothetical protein